MEERRREGGKGGRRPARGEGGGLERGEGAGETALAGGAVGGLSRARTCGGGSPEGDERAGGPEREKQEAQTGPGSEIETRKSPRRSRRGGARGEQRFQQREK